jgi:hypothetical protein
MKRTGLELFAGLLMELLDTGVPLCGTIHERVELAYQRLTADVAEKIVSEQEVNKLYEETMVLIGRFDVSISVFKFMEKEPDAHRAVVAFSILEKLEGVAAK